MEEGTSKAIPLRRSRATSRTVATQPDRRWTDTLGSGAQLLLAPPRQAWLAGLGVGALALRTIRATWVHAVTEGVAAEDWLRNALGAAPADPS